MATVGFVLSVIHRRYEKTRLNTELEAEVKRFGVKEQEVKEAAKLKRELAKRDLDLATLIKAAEEFPDDSS